MMQDLFHVYYTLEHIKGAPKDLELTLLLIRKSITNLRGLERKYARQLALKEALCKGILHDPPTWEACANCPNLGASFDGCGYCCTLSNLALDCSDLTGVKNDMLAEHKNYPVPNSPEHSQGGLLQ